MIIHDYGITENKQPYIVMELIEGPSLHGTLKERDYLPLKEALPILLSVSEGFAHAHEHGVLHRDIKPENIMLKPIVGRPKDDINLLTGLPKTDVIDFSEFGGGITGHGVAVWSISNVHKYGRPGGRWLIIQPALQLVRKDR